MPLTGYIGMVESYSSYQRLLRKDPTEAERLSTDIRDKWDISDSSTGLSFNFWLCTLNSTPLQLKADLWISNKSMTLCFITTHSAAVRLWKE